MWNRNNDPQNKSEEILKFSLRLHVARLVLLTVRTGSLKLKVSLFPDDDDDDDDDDD